MKDVTVSPWHASPISYDVKGLTIAVSGVNRLISNGGGAAIYANNSIFIEGDGSLYCSGGNSYWPAVSLDEKTTLTISDITFSVSNGIRGERGKKDQKLILKNVKGYNIEGGIENLTEFTTEDCDIIKPEDGYFDKNKRAVVDADGNVAKEVQIGKLKFPLYIAGKQVSLKNCNDLSVIDGVTVASGSKFMYDPGTKTLTMKGVTVSVGDYKNAIDNRGVEGLKIKVSGTNRLESTNYSPLVCDVPTNISGDGTLTTVGTGSSGVYVNKTTVTISDITLEASGKWGIDGYDGTEGETLILKNAKVIAKGSVAGIAKLASFSAQDCKILTPVRGKFDATQHAVVDFYGNIAQEVKIGKPYGLYIAGKPVTPFNCNDLSQIDDGVTVASSGEFRYEPTTKTLYMKDVTVSAEGVDGDAIDNRGVDGLKIVVLGENHLQATTHIAFSCEVPTFIEGSGSLTATANKGDAAVYAFNTTLSISGITLKASGRRGIAGYDGQHGEKLSIQNAKVSATGTEAGIARLAEVFLDACDVRVPLGAYFDPIQFAIVDSDGKVAEWVEIERTYGLYVAGEQVTSANCNALENIVGADVAHGGHFHYRPGTSITGRAQKNCI